MGETGEAGETGEMGDSGQTGARSDARDRGAGEPPSDFRVRTLREDDDLEVLTRLLHRAYRPLAEAGLRYLATHQDVETTRQRVADGTTLLGVAGGRIVGTVTVKPPGRDDGCGWYARPDVATLGQLAVEPELQGRGLAGLLLDRAETLARSWGAAEVALDTSEHAARLIATYERRGYRLVDRADWRPVVNYTSVVLSLRLREDEPATLPTTLPTTLPNALPNGLPTRRFPDHFSSQAADYARSRPTYPARLLDAIAGLAAVHDAAWDCATGNGQAATGLAERFARVLATDGSAEQLAHATQHPRVTYSLGTAEDSGLPDASVDAVTVAQAAHWLDLPRFVAECRRVARPGAPVVLWGYTLAHVDAAVDATLDAFYAAVEPFWPPGRERLDAGYHLLEWDLEDIALPPMEMTASWSVDRVLRYLATWSSVVACERATGRSPLEDVAPALVAAWGEGRRTMRWPLTVRAGRV